MRFALVASILLGCAACARALKEPSPIAAYAPGHTQGRSASEATLEEMDRLWDEGKKRLADGT